MQTQPVPLQSRPGIKRDGTVLEGDYYINGQWCRFQRGRPRKIGGYQSVSRVPEIARGMNSFSANGLQYVHIGGATTFGQYQINNNGNLNAFVDRTPVALVDSPNNLWQIDTFYQAGAVNQNRLIAHAAPNLADIDSRENRVIWFGNVTDATVLTDSGLPQVSGGIVSLGPYLFSFGNDGRIGWSLPNNPTVLAFEAFITPQKIVKGIPLRGAGRGPAGLFWSLDSLIRANFVGGDVVWDFDTLASDISVLSSQSIIEYDSVFYWIGVDRFLLFNGVVREIPNELNQNWFFDNLNFNQRQKVFAFKVPRFGEIWWCYPRETATECTHAIIYNTREGTWYDTQLPDGGRSIGLYAKVYNKPFMVDVDAIEDQFTLWQHETTVDRVDGTNIDAVQSFFETNEISMLSTNQPLNRSTHIGRLEPDFVQVGDMTLTIRGRSNAKSSFISGNPVTFPDVASVPTDETIKVKEVRRLMSFRFESNVQGGNYEMGEVYIHIAPADSRVES